MIEQELKQRMDMLLSQWQVLQSMQDKKRMHEHLSKLENWIVEVRSQLIKFHTDKLNDNGKVA